MTSYAMKEHREALEANQPMGTLSLSTYEANAHTISQDDWATLWIWGEPSSSLLAGQRPILQMQSL